MPKGTDMKLAEPATGRGFWPQNPGHDTRQLGDVMEKSREDISNATETQRQRALRCGPHKQEGRGRARASAEGWEQRGTNVSLPRPEPPGGEGDTRVCEYVLTHRAPGWQASLQVWPRGVHKEWDVLWDAATQTEPGRQTLGEGDETPGEGDTW